MPMTRASMSIWTPRALPSFGRNSEYGKLEPTIRNRVAFGEEVPAGLRPEQADRSSDEGKGRRGRPRVPGAPLRDAGPKLFRRHRRLSSDRRGRLRLPRGITRRAVPSLRTWAARRTSSSPGTIVGLAVTVPVCTVSCACTGVAAASSWMSLGTMTQVTVRSASAIRNARSRTCRADSGVMIVCTYSLATSLNSEGRSTSCW